MSSTVTPSASGATQPGATPTNTRAHTPLMATNASPFTAHAGLAR